MPAEELPVFLAIHVCSRRRQRLASFGKEEIVWGLTHWNAEQTEADLHACDGIENVQDPTIHHPTVCSKRKSEAENIFEDE